MTEKELITAISKLPVEFMRKTIHTRPDHERGNNLVTIRFWVEEEEKVEGS